MYEKRIVAKNGIPVYSLTNENNHSFFISMFLKAGCMYESAEENGITHFLEHAAIRNVNKLMDYKLYRELDKYGMEFNATTYSEMVQFYISGASSHFKVAAEMISRILSPIVLDRSELLAERERIKAEIREASDKSTLAFVAAEEEWRGTSLTQLIAGTLGSVSKVSLKSLESYRRRIYNKENIFFYVTGNVDNDNLSYLTDLVGAYELVGDEKHDNKAPVPKCFMSRQPKIRIKNADFTKIRYSFDVDMSSVKSAELDLLYDIVLRGYSSDFFIELSENKGLFYDLGGAVERYSNVALFSFSYELKESKLYEAAQMTAELLRGYTERLLDTDRCMKASYVDNAYMLFDDPSALSFTFAYDNHILNLGYSGIEDRREAYERITPERLREVAREIFRPENMTVTLKANKKKIDAERLERIIFGE
ncbi:MAG: insulinase family protein [Clostridia bacterium]|nr:insulinase family protein [Clostridia bacterium]